MICKEYLSEQAILPKGCRGRRAVRIFPALLLFLSLLGQLTVRVKITEENYRLEALRNSALHADAELRERRYELASLTRPVMLEQRARSELQMVSLPPQRVRRIQVSF